MSRPDITRPADVHLLIDRFYAEVRPDPLIGHFFTHVDWTHHTPRIEAFWEQLLLGTARFEGDPMGAHRLLNARLPMEREHFDRWVQLFHATVDALFTGPKAEEAKQRASAIAGVMLLKVKGRT